MEECKCWCVAKNIQNTYPTQAHKDTIKPIETQT